MGEGETLGAKKNWKEARLEAIWETLDQVEDPQRDVRTGQGG